MILCLRAPTAHSNSRRTCLKNTGNRYRKLERLKRNNMAGRTILIIDTDTETIQKIMSTLESEGYLVFSASSKEVSITMANKVKPSLIFINVGLSGASGLEICTTIHDAETLGSVPTR